MSLATIKSGVLQIVETRGIINVTASRAFDTNYTNGDRVRLCIVSCLHNTGASGGEAEVKAVRDTSTGSLEYCESGLKSGTVSSKSMMAFVVNPHDVYSILSGTTLTGSNTLRHWWEIDLR